MKEVREGYKLTELGNIPDNWRVEKLDKLFDFYGGVSISRDKQSKSGVYYLHYGDIHKKNKNYFSIAEDGNWLPKIDVDKLKEGVLLNTGDVVFADASEDYEGIGKSVVIINEDNEHFVSGLHTIVAKDKAKELHTLYKKYCFNTVEARKQFRILATGATVYGISRSNIKNIKILIPTIKEQEKIAFTLSSVDEQIQNTDKLMEKTMELKKGLMQRLLTKGIGHSRFKDTEIGRIPEEWEIRKLGDIAEYINGKAFKPSDWSEEGLPIVRIQNLNGSDEYNYCNKQVEGKYYIKNNELLFSWSGSRGTSFGPFIWKGDKAVLNQHIFKVELDEELNKDYCYFALKKITQHIEENAHGSAGLVHITKGELGKFKIPIPKELEQMKIALILSSVDKQIDQYESKKEKLQELKKGLMQKLLTGSIRVKI